MLQSGSLRSKIAQRIFALFIICGLLPFAVLAYVAYHQTVEFFETKNQEQLRDLAKLFGLDIHEKLELLDTSLKIIASTVNATGKLPEPAYLERMAGGHKDRWVELFLEPSRRTRQLPSVQQDVPDFTAGGQKQLAAGKAVISLIPLSAKFPTRIFLSVLVDPGKSDSPVLTGEIDTSYLWGFNSSRLLASHIEPCVVDLQGVILMCSSERTDSLPQNLKNKLLASTIGNFEWTEQDQHYLASYWTVPMKYEFQIPGWIVLLRSSKEGAFASIKDLQTTFVLSIVISIGLSLLLAIFQIRKRLVPVEKLQEATRRIAKNDFAVNVQVKSNDEFDELAASLNEMADRLGRQFNTITTTGEIDRAVLSLLDTAKIVETILSRIAAVLHYQFGTLTLFNGDLVRQWHLETRHKPDLAKGDPMADTHRQCGGLAPQNANADLITEQSWPAEATEERNPLAYAVWKAKTLIVDDAPRPEYPAATTAMPNTVVKSFLGAPLIVKDQVLAVLSFYAAETRKFTSEEVDFVQRLSNQAAVAIYNSQLHERTLNQASELLKANRAKDDFLSVMSHELRTPLNVIMGYVRVLQDKVLGDLTKDQTRVLETVERQANDLLDMINSVVEATLIQAGAVLVDHQPILPADIIETLKRQTALPAEKSLTIDWRYDADLPALVSDRRKLERILKILIHNATKFTAAGHVTIAAIHAADGSAVDFKVVDTGIGISTESCEKIFEIFHQVDYSKTREYGGLGLGLFIAKELADLVGATLRVESQIGQGSTFTLTVPLTTNTDLASDTIRTFISS